MSLCLLCSTLVWTLPSRVCLLQLAGGKVEKVIKKTRTQVRVPATKHVRQRGKCVRDLGVCVCVCVWCRKFPKTRRLRLRLGAWREKDEEENGSDARQGYSLLKI